MAKHHPDLIMCRKQCGIAIGRLCEKCDGKCVICDSYVRPAQLARTSQSAARACHNARAVAIREDGGQHSAATLTQPLHRMSRARLLGAQRRCSFVAGPALQSSYRMLGPCGAGPLFA